MTHQETSMMTPTLTQKIVRIRELAVQQGHDDEFILSGSDYAESVTDPETGRNMKDPTTGQWLRTEPKPHWQAGVSNPVGSVRLGESEPIFSFDSDTIEGAVDGLLEQMEAL